MSNVIFRWAIGGALVVAALAAYVFLGGIIKSPAKAAERFTHGISTTTGTTSHTNFSAETWLNSTTNGENLFTKGDAVAQDGPENFTYMTDAGHIIFGFRNATGLHVVKSPATYADALPHHVVSTAMNGTMQLMVDGAVVATRTL